MNFQLWTTVFGIALIFVLGFIIQWLLNWRKYILKVNKLPGKKTSKCYWILGNFFDVVGPRQDIFLKIRSYINKFADHPVVLLWFVLEARVILTKAEAVESVLNNTNNLDKSSLYHYLHKWLGLGLLTSSGQKWHSRRKMLTPSFHFKILEDFIDVFNEQAVILTKKLQQHAGKESFDVYPYISLCALDIICETAMSRSINAQGNSESEYVKAVNDVAEIVNRRGMKPWYNWDWFYYNLSPLGKLEKKNLSILHGFTNDVITERRQERISKKSKPAKDDSEEEIVFGKKRRLAFLDTLLEYSENGKSLSDESIREEVDTFMFEGHDTTSSGINFVLYLLGHNPEVQKKVHEELDAIFGDSDRHATAADLTEMKYLECAIKEALRIYPPVPFFSRRLKTPIKFGGHEIPAEVNVSIGVYFVHRDPKYYPDPEKYDPNRFLPENISKRHPFSYIPFSAGARNCIGQKFAFMEEKIVVSHLMRNFRVKSAQKRDEVSLLVELILRPVNGIWINLENRKKL